MTRICGRAVAVALLTVVASPALAQTAAAPFAASVSAAKALGEGAYWVAGPISNSGFIVGQKGVIVIDAQTFAPNAKALLSEIAKVTPKPVKAVILTHGDPDHINGLTAFPLGLKIIAQQNTKAVIEGVIADPKSNGLAPDPAISNYVPTDTVRDTERLTLDGVPLVLIHTGPAHTDGDLVVFLPRQKVVYAGDLLTPAVGPYPGIHLDKNGSSLGWLASIKALLALEANSFVTGHGEVLTRDEVRARLVVAEQRRAEIAALVEKNKSLPDIKAALHDVPLAGVAARFPTFIDTTYQELTTK